jgi:hypothetical protein
VFEPKYGEVGAEEESVAAVRRSVSTELLCIGTQSATAPTGFQNRELGPGMDLWETKQQEDEGNC